MVDREKGATRTESIPKTDTHNWVNGVCSGCGAKDETAKPGTTDATKPGATEPTSGNSGDLEPSDPESPLGTILLIVAVVAAAGAGGFLGFRAIQKKKKAQ